MSNEIDTNSIPQLLENNISISPSDLIKLVLCAKSQERLI